MAERQELLISSGANILVYQHRQAQANTVPHSPEQDFSATRSIHIPTSRKTSAGVLDPPKLDLILKTRLSLLKLK